jgi:hypothetical protein
MNLFALCGLTAATATICGVMANVEGRSWLLWTVVGGVATCATMLLLETWSFAGPAIVIPAVYLAFWVLGEFDAARKRRDARNRHPR